MDLNQPRKLAILDFLSKYNQNPSDAFGKPAARVGIPTFEPTEGQLTTLHYELERVYKSHREENLIRFLLTADLEKIKDYFQALLAEFAENAKTGDRYGRELDLPRSIPWNMDTLIREVLPNYRKTGDSILDLLSHNITLSAEELVQVVEYLVKDDQFVNHYSKQLVRCAVEKLPKGLQPKAAEQFMHKDPYLVPQYCTDPAIIDKVILERRLDLTNEAVLQCKYLSKEALTKVITQADGHRDRDTLASNSIIPEKMLYKWAKATKRDELLEVIAGNDNCTELTLSIIIKNPSAARAIRKVCEHKNVTKQILSTILIMPNAEYRACAQQAMKRFEGQPKTEPKKKVMFGSFMKVI